MEGKITLYSSHVKALFDTGATHSFNSIKIIQKLGFMPQKLDIALNDVQLLGATVKLGHVCKDCSLHLEDHSLLANLVVLSMNEFAVMLGVNWITKYHAKLDCVRKRISFSVLGGQSFDFQCNSMSDTFFTSCLKNIEVDNKELTIYLLYPQLEILKKFIRISLGYFQRGIQPSIQNWYLAHCQYVKLHIE